MIILLMLILLGKRPTCCPFCQSEDIGHHLGRWWCNDCEAEGSY